MNDRSGDVDSRNETAALESAARLACRIHCAGLRAYPKAFRREFGDEMNEVFRQCAAEATKAGRFSLVELCLRELVDMPFHFLREHLDARRPNRGEPLMHDPRCPRCHAQTEIDTRYCAACGHAFVGWRERAVDLLEPRLEGTPAWLRGLLALLLASLAGLSAGHLVTARGLYFIGSYALLGLVLLAFASYVGRVLAEGNRASLTGRLGRVFLASTIFGVGLFSVQLVDRVYIGSLMGTEHQGEIALPGIRALTIGHPDEALVSAATKRYDNVLHENKGLARFRSNTYVSEDGRLVTILLTESIDGIYSLVGLLLAASVALVAYRQAVEARAIRA